MHAPPIVDRLEELIHKKPQMINLIDGQWTDKSIALYVGSDTKSVRRFRRMYKMFGCDLCRDQINAVLPKRLQAAG